MNRQQLVEFIAGIPDLTAHRFMDTDDHFSVKIHDPHEVARRVADALLSGGYQIHNDWGKIRGENEERQGH